MQQSNGYIIRFTVGMTVVCAVLLALAYTSLKPLHEKNEETDKKTNILSAYMAIEAGADIEALYEKNIEGIVVNSEGQLVEGVNANEVVARTEYKKKDVSEKLFPVFKFRDTENEGQFKAYIVPVYGNGLWDEIWGFIAVGPDFNTILGTSFDHKGETPGLGAEITTTWFKDSFKGKKVFNAQGELESVTVLKGNGNADINMHQVDGVAGASMTTNGVSNMLSSYFTHYEKFFKSKGE